METLPYAPVELLKIAGTDDGHICYWVMRPEANPDAWTITVNESRDTRWVDFDGGLVAFLIAMHKGIFRVPFFPDDFPTDPPAFDKHPSPAELERLLGRSPATRRPTGPSAAPEAVA